jgi:aminomethyltransferase
MVPFAGWEMPERYTSILAEHNAVRQAAGLFDISHMGRVFVHGVEALPFLQRLTTNDVAALSQDQAQYSLLCRADGTTLDDVLVYRLPEHFLVVVNASNRARDLAFFQEHLLPGVELDDATERTAMLAVQGPQAIAIVQKLSPEPLDQLRRYHCTAGDVANVNAFLARTGYTGEDGLEIIVGARQAQHVWDALMAAGKPLGLQPCGLGARDTLRTEAGLPLYGHELSDTTNPLEAGLDSFVSLEKQPASLAGTALRRVVEHGPIRRLVGLRLADRAIARQETPVFAGQRQVGVVTSGTFAPTLQQSIAMAYLDPAVAVPGEQVEVDVRGQRHSATLVRLPFYRRRRRGARGRAASQSEE